MKRKCQQRNNRKPKKKGTKLTRRKIRRKTMKWKSKGSQKKKSKHPRLDNDYTLDSDDAVVANETTPSTHDFVSIAMT